MTYVFYGNDIKLIKTKVQELEKKIFSTYRNIEKVYVDSFNPKDIDEIYLKSLFYSLKYIRIYAQSLDEVGLLLSKETKNFLVIVFYTDEDHKKVEAKLSKLNKNKIKVELSNCFLPKPYQIFNILQKKFGNKLSLLVIDFLSKNITSMTEIDKLEEFLKKRGKIDLNDVPYVLGEIEVPVFSVVDDIIFGRKETSIMELNNLTPEYRSYLINSIFHSLKLLYKLKKMLSDGLSENQIQEEIGLHPFVTKKYLEITKKTSFEKLKNILLYFPFLDMETKKHATNYFLESFILNFELE